MKTASVNSTRFRIHSPWIIGQIYIWAFVLTSSFITAVFLHYSPLQVSHLSFLKFGINAGGLFLGGFITARKTKERGWYYGGMQGILYTLLLFIISFLAFDSGMSINPLLFCVFSFGMGSLGGVVGVNTKSYP